MLLNDFILERYIVRNESYIMRNLYFYITAIAFISFLQPYTFCQSIKIDHIIAVTKNLDKAIDEYSNLGFTIKPGRLHTNGLLNAHIKFPNNTSFELMTIKGDPKDKMAQDYQSLINNGEGGVYLAFTGLSTDSLAHLFDELAIEYTIQKEKAWNYISFPATTSFGHLFFIEYKLTFEDSVQFFRHDNQSIAVKEVKIDGSKEVIALFKALGLWQNNQFEFETTTGNILVFPLTNSSKRPRIRGISFSRKNGKEAIQLNF